MRGSDSLGQPSSHTGIHEPSIEKDTAGTAVEGECRRSGVIMDG